MCSKSLQRETSRKVPREPEVIFEATNRKSGSPNAHFTWSRLSVFRERGRNVKGVGIKKRKREREQQRQCLYSLVGAAAGLG